MVNVLDLNLTTPFAPILSFYYVNKNQISRDCFYLLSVETKKSNPFCLMPTGIITLKNIEIWLQKAHLLKFRQKNLDDEQVFQIHKSCSPSHFLMKKWKHVFKKHPN